MPSGHRVLSDAFTFVRSTFLISVPTKKNGSYYSYFFAKVSTLEQSNHGCKFQHCTLAFSGTRKLKLEILAKLEIKHEHESYTASFHCYGCHFRAVRPWRCRSCSPRCQAS